MEENFKNEVYEQFETMDTEVNQRFKGKNKFFLYPKNIIKFLLLSLSLFCILFLLFQVSKFEFSPSKIYLNHMN